MCFSAGASFGAGVVLTGLGMASVRKAAMETHWPFAGIPLIFGVQQITEGFLWLALTNPHYATYRLPAMYLFLFFAQVLWPVWVAFSMYKLEPDGTRRKAMLTLMGIGTVVSAYLAFCLLNFRVDAVILDHHISYHQHYPEFIDRSYGWL